MAKGKKTGGRVAGTPNKSTADIKALAQKHTDGAIAELARLAVGAESEAARVSAIKELLDRGHGKPSQQLEHTGTVKISHEQALEELT
jgi:hypothetical protein